MTMLHEESWMMGSNVLQGIGPLLLEAGIVTRAEIDPDCPSLTVTVLSADGSSRRFIRLRRGEQPLCLAVFPAGGEERDLAEARSAWQIGRHLHQRGIPVPAIFGRQQESGAILFEDLGDIRLHDLVLATDFADPAARRRIVGLYEQALIQLVAMQLDAAAGFEDCWCWDSPCYNRQTMVERESGYFLRAFWQGLLGRAIPAGLEDEFRSIAGQAAGAPVHFFLHRDFQSRNIMVKDGRIRIIDYQGGRRGPLGYDLASLLTDPYAALPEEIREHLLQFYLAELSRRLVFDSREFLRYYSLLALQRNLQIVGAFAFLSQVRGKAFFAGFIGPAVAMLHARLREPLFQQCTVLRRTAEAAVEALSR